MQSNSFISNLTKGINSRVRSLTLQKGKKADLNWFKTKYLKHIAAGKLRAYQYKGKNMYYVNPPELLHGLTEIFIDEVYNLNLPKSPTIIDCGANIGMSVIYLKERFPDARIIAFEPDSINFELLTKNIESFGLQNVEARKEAVWIENTAISFASDGTMGSKIDAASSTSNTVKATRLKDYLNEKVHFLKIDIEGSEYQVLKDIQENLENVENMFFEYHGKFNQNSELVTILDILTKAGFSFYLKEATNVYNQPFVDTKKGTARDYDLQLNIFCFR